MEEAAAAAGAGGLMPLWMMGPEVLKALLGSTAGQSWTGGQPGGSGWGDAGTSAAMAGGRRMLLQSASGNSSEGSAGAAAPAAADTSDLSAALEEGLTMIWVLVCACEWPACCTQPHPSHPLAAPRPAGGTGGSGGRGSPTPHPPTPSLPASLVPYQCHVCLPACVSHPSRQRPYCAM